MKEIVFMDGFDSVKDANTQNKEVFSTKLPKELAELIGRTHIPSDVIDNIVFIFNKTGLDEVDDYLLNEGKISQDEREIIMEALFKFFYHG